MKIREVHMEKLFSLEKYNNERIGFIAEVDEGENADKVCAELHFKILDIEDCLSAYRRILASLDYASDSFRHKQSQIEGLESDLANVKVKIEELVNIAEKGDVDARLQHACSRQSYKDMTKALAEYKSQLKKLHTQVKTLTESKMTLRQRIKEGNFSLEGIEIPYIPRTDYY